MSKSKRNVVALYAVGWRKTSYQEATVEPFMVEVAAFETGKTYVVKDDKWFGQSGGYDAGKAFRYASRLLKEDLGEFRVGLTPKEAINLAFAEEAQRREKANEELADIERCVSALLRLELQAVKT